MEGLATASTMTVLEQYGMLFIAGYGGFLVAILLSARAIYDAPRNQMCAVFILFLYLGIGLSIISVYVHRMVARGENCAHFHL